MNLYLVSGIAFFWVYAWYGSVTIGSGLPSAVLSVVFAALFATYMEMGRPENAASRSVPLRTGALLLGLGFSLILATLSVHELTAGFATDSFYHSSLSLIHSMRLLQTDVIPTGSPFFQKMMAVPYWKLLYVVNALLILSMIYLLHQVTTIKNRFLRVVSLFLFFILARTAIREFVIKGDIHPPLRLVPLTVSTLIGGVWEPTFRWAGLFASGLVASLMVRLWREKIGGAGAITSAWCLITLPLLWHVSVLPEASIWSAAAFAFVTIYLVAQEWRGQDLPYQFLFTVLAVVSLMRQSAFVGLVPLGLLYLRDLARKEAGFKARFKRVLIDGFPVLIMVPWTLYIAYTGTPATDHSGTPWHAKMYEAFSDGAAIRYLWIHWRWPGFILFLCGLIPRKSRAYFFVLSTFILALGLFYSVIPHVWGLARYQLELGLPFVVLGLFNVLNFLKKIMPKSKTQARELVTVGLGVALCLFNYHEFKSIRRVNGPVDESTYFDRSRDGTIPSLSEYPFATSRALRLAKEKNLQVGLFLDGITYGVMPHVLAGYTWEEVRLAEGMPVAWGGADARQVNEAPMIRSILLIDWGAARNNQSADTLRSLGWNEIAQIPDDDVPDNVIRLLQRH